VVVDSAHQLGVYLAASILNSCFIIYTDLQTLLMGLKALNIIKSSKIKIKSSITNGTKTEIGLSLG